MFLTDLIIAGVSRGLESRWCARRYGSGLQPSVIETGSTWADGPGWYGTRRWRWIGQCGSGGWACYDLNSCPDHLHFLIPALCIAAIAWNSLSICQIIPLTFAIYIDPPFNSNRNYEVFWGETKEKRSFEDRHESTQAYIEFMRPRCVEIARVLKKTGSFYYHCDWHASHYVKIMLAG